MNSDECAGHWKARRDEAMRERNKVIALLARLFPAGLSQQTDAGGRTRPCVIIDLPTGQVSWHYATEDAWPFEGLPAYLGEYDGHTEEEKYQRLAQWTRLLDLGEQHSGWRPYSTRSRTAPS